MTNRVKWGGGGVKSCSSVRGINSWFVVQVERLKSEGWCSEGPVCSGAWRKDFPVSKGWAVGFVVLEFE